MLSVKSGCISGCRPRHTQALPELFYRELHVYAQYQFYHVATKMEIKKKVKARQLFTVVPS